MTPRRLDWRSVRPKLRTISELLDVLVELGPVDEQRLRDDRPTALAVERILTLVVELAFATNSHVAVVELKRAPDSYAESFELAARAGLIDPALARRILPSAKMRNVLVHAYLDVDHRLVAAAVPMALEHYRDYVRQVSGWFLRRGENGGEPDGATTSE